MSDFEPVSELKIGRIVEVSGTFIRATLDAGISELTRSYSGRVYAIGQIGSIVKIHFGRRLIFGFVTLLRMHTDEDEVGAVSAQSAETEQRVMEIELFAEGFWSTGEGRLTFLRGVTTYPLPRQAVYLLTRDEARLVYQAAEGHRKNGADPLVPFATYVGSDSTVCRADIDRMFGLHCAVLGSTGTGKSGAVAALLHAIVGHVPLPEQPCRPRIIIIDPHGEYGRAFAESAVVYRAYDPIGLEETAGERIKLPYWLMSADEFRSLTIGKTEEEATSQNNIVYKALTHARMVAAGLVDNAPVGYGGPGPADGGSPDQPRPRAGVDSARLAEFDRDKPRPFSLTEFVNHITYLQAARVQGGVLAKVTETDFAKSFKSILDKISVLRRDPRIKFLMENWTNNGPSLDEVIAQFVGNVDGNGANHKGIRIIDISGLPNEVAGPLTAVIGRLLFQYKLYQTREEREKDPVLLVCEEAHRYVPDRGEAEYAAAQSAIRRIAREGRKYGIGLMLISQRPADIESTVISQCNTWLVLRLTNAADQQHVARFLPDGLAGMSKVLPSLGRQEALFVGEGAALPARVRINSLKEDQLPRSSDVPYAAGWSNPPLSQDEIRAITSRMTALGE
jgi:uncharacterized protein